MSFPAKDTTLFLPINSLKMNLGRGLSDIVRVPTLKKRITMLDKSSKIYVAGHRGLVGSAIWNNLMQRGFTNL